MQEFINLLKESDFKFAEKQITIPLAEFKALENKSMEYQAFLSNEYTNTLNQGYFDKECIYTKILYKAFWTILEKHEKTAKYFRILNNLNDIYLKSNDLLIPIDKNMEVANYLAKISNGKINSYLDYKSRIYKSYGFDINEYIKYKFSDDFDITIKSLLKSELQKYKWTTRPKNKFTIVEYQNNFNKLHKSYMSVKQINNLKYVKFFKQEHDNDFIVSYLKKKKDTLNEDTCFMDYSKGIHKDIHKDIYKQNNNDISYLPYYKYPKLRALEINNINFQFSILDKNLDDLIKELKSIYKSETINYRKQLGSIGRQLFSEEEPNYGSAKTLVHASLIYYYRNKCTNYDDALLLYSFHILMHHKKDFEINDEDIIILKHDNILTKNTSEGEVAEQIRQIKSILNLD